MKRWSWNVGTEASDSSGIDSRGGRGKTLLFISKGTAAGGPAAGGVGRVGPDAGPNMLTRDGWTGAVAAGASGCGRDGGPTVWVAWLGRDCGPYDRFTSACTSGASAVVGADDDGTDWWIEDAAGGPGSGTCWIFMYPVAARGAANVFVQVTVGN